MVNEMYGISACQYMTLEPVKHQKQPNRGDEVNIKDYKYIVEIAEQKNISKAAAALYITQSALTRFLQRVEEELGASLFFRQGNHLVLTEIGQCYVEKGRKSISLCI